MAELTEYKCPACGGAMEFNSTTQNMKCPYCDTEMSVEEFEALQTPQPVTEQQPQVPSPTEPVGWTAEETQNMNIFVCESCGGEIVADRSTGATSCPFCGNRVVMKGQFSGDIRPDYIIPFKKDKKQAKEAYLTHIAHKPFLPKVFKEQNHIDEIKGVYVPFWLFDFTMQGGVQYEATDSRSWTSGDTRYTETSYYEGEVAGSLNFERIAADASTKMNDDLMECIEPFDFSEAVPFRPAYLAGYLADRYDVDLEERMTRAQERASETAQDIFMDHAALHQATSKKTGNATPAAASYLYALYPVWLLQTTWGEKHFLFAMNGQTGKMVGNLPADMKQFWLYVATRGAIFGVIATIAIILFFM